MSLYLLNDIDRKQQLSIILDSRLGVQFNIFPPLARSSGYSVFSDRMQCESLLLLEITTRKFITKTSLEAYKRYLYVQIL